MSNTHHFFDLDASSPIPAVVVLFGRDAFLRRLAGEQVKAGVLGQDADVPYAKLTGSVATWADVADEVNTMSLFGGSGRRLVVLEEADSFVTKFRDELEKFLERKRSGGVLVLQVDRWAANTRLYKKCDELGLQIECNPPEKKAGKRPVLDGPRLAKWFVTRTPALHGAKITSGAVEQLIELLGPELGLIDQEIERLALFVEVGGTIDEQLVLEQVHGGQLQEMWNLVDAAVEGQSSEAILQLDRFFQAGDKPQKLYGQIAWSLRRYAAATRIFQRGQRRGDAISLRDALKSAGFPAWPKALAEAERRLKLLGQIRGGDLFRKMLEIDIALKGTHSHEQRGRLLLETLIAGFAKEVDPRRA